MSSPFEEISKPLQEFWVRQKEVGNVQAVPRGANCMLCASELTDQDEDHSVCNICWVKLGDDNEV